LQLAQSHGPEAERDLACQKTNRRKKRSTAESSRRKVWTSMAGVFISYRRTDAGGWAGRLRDHLALRFGSNVIWQDVEDLNVGKDYLSQILKQIKSSDAVLIVIGPHWLKDGRKRLGNPEDVLRIEIQHALKNKRAAVIPTLVGGAAMPARKELPPAIAGLVDRHGVALSDVDWARSMQFLFERLQDIVRGSEPTEPLDDLHSTLFSMQEQYFGLIAQPQRALEVASKALNLLDRQMPSHPHDHYLQMFRGYFLKNQAMSFRDLGDIEAFENSLQEADRAFQTIRSEAELYLSNAYNGIGSVTMLKSASHRSLRQALQWIDKALELVPDHQFARHDREEALRFLKTAKG
jgi:tetratricopeptide (TPR) repeat protein